MKTPVPEDPEDDVEAAALRDTSHAILFALGLAAALGLGFTALVAGFHCLSS